MTISFDNLALASPFFDESHHAWRAQVRRFVESEIVPFIDDWEEAGEVPLDLWSKAAAIGLLQLGYPEGTGKLTSPDHRNLFSIFTPLPYPIQRTH